MEKKVKIFKLITILLIIIAVSLISFIGIFKTKLNIMENIIPDFTLGMELGGAREFKFTLNQDSEEKSVYVDEAGNYLGDVIEEENEEPAVSLEATVPTDKDVVAEEEVNKLPYKVETRTVKANEDSVLNKESFETTKKIIGQRLEKANIPEYNIRLDSINGNFILEVPQDANTDKAYSLAVSQGKFELIDSQTGIILLDNRHVKDARATYYNESGYQAFLYVELTNEGSEILKDISKKYVQVKNEQDEDMTQYVELKLDGQTIFQTYFGDELDQGVLPITMGAATTDYNTFIENYNEAEEFANQIRFGKTPNAYVLQSDNFVKSQIDEKQILVAKIVYFVAIVIISIVLVAMYKGKGVLATIASVGYIAVSILAIKYTNVVITLNSIFAILGITAVNYVFMFNFLNKTKTDSVKHAFTMAIKELNITVIPLWVVAIIFTFMSPVAISSVGMIVFWGLFVHAIYSFVITRNLYI